MRVLVTGASGMLGGGVARYLLARGEQVTVTQRRSALIECGELLGDLTDPQLRRRVVSEQEAVIHLAAKVDVVGRASEFYRVNVDATAELLNEARSAGVRRFVYISSPSVAHSGTAIVGSAAEPANPRTARGHYSRSKAIAEKVALSFDGPRFAVTVVRPHLVWGPGDTQLVARIVERARAGRLALIGSGAALIDTTYIDNAVEAIVAAVDHCEQAHGQALVVSNGEPRTVAEVIGRLCEAAGVSRPRLQVPYRLAWWAGGVVDGIWAARTLLGEPGDPPITRFLAEQLSTAHWFDQRHTRELLQWSPRVSLDEGFAKLAAAYR